MMHFVPLYAVVCYCAVGSIMTLNIYTHYVPYLSGLHWQIGYINYVNMEVT